MDNDLVEELKNSALEALREFSDAELLFSDGILDRERIAEIMAGFTMARINFVSADAAKLICNIMSGK